MYESGSLIDGRYRVIRPLGHGGYGRVYLCDELGSGQLLFGVGSGGDPERIVLRRVALKVMDETRGDPKRFLTEVRALCTLNHPHIVTVFHYGRDREAYVAMEYVDGTPWSQLLGASSQENPGRTLRYLIQVAEALAHAHSRGVVHKDLKPANILLSRDDRPKVVDFGLAWLVHPGSEATQRIGTPGFLAPELIDGDGRNVDHRADVYALGATIHAVFAGQSPFAVGDNRNATILQQMSGAAKVSEALPAGLRELVRACIAFDPFDRPRTASQVADELRQIALSNGGILSGSAVTRRLPVEGELPARVDLRDARVTKVEPFDHPTRGPGVKFVAQTGGIGAPDSVGVFAYAGSAQSGERRAHDAIAMAWPGAELSLYHARPIRTARGEACLAVDHTTAVVIEPYFPVSVTDMSRVDGVRAGPCAGRYLLNLRAARPSAEALLAGSVAHSLLEGLIEHGGDTSPAAFNSEFERAVQRHRIGLVAAGLDDSQIPRFRESLRTHFRHLRDWTVRHKGVAPIAEVRRYSSRYGVEGRIDVALIEPEVLRIAELKTGKTESMEHERQLRAYALLWDAWAGANGRRVEGHLVYSATGRSKLLPRREHEREREVLSARNDIVATHRWFSDGDTAFRPPSYMDDPARCADHTCRYQRDTCAWHCGLLGRNDGSLEAPSEQVGDIWGGAGPDLVRAAREWYFHFVRLIEREYRSASRAMGDVFRRESLPDRIRELRAIGDAAIDALDPAGSVVHFRCDNATVFSPGDDVIVHRGDFDAEPMLAGRVRSSGGGRIAIACDCVAFAASLPGDGWTIDRDVARIGHRDAHRALFGFLASRDARRIERIVMPHRAPVSDQRLLPGIPGPANDEVVVRGGSGRELNDQQRAAVEQALMEHEAFLIQGPPGTGKTTVVAELVQRLVSRGQRVLLAAFTNTAVDTMLAHVVRAGVRDVLRVGSPHTAAIELVQAIEQGGRSVDSHFTESLSRDTPSLDALRRRLAAVPVVAATTNGCGSSPFFDVLDAPHRKGSAEPVHVATFDVVIVDEASQLTEPMAIAAIQRARRFVLVGDDFQLAPVVSAADALSVNLRALSGDLAAAGIAGLDRSLFERLKPFVPHIFLSRQYRMNREVQAFPSRCFYGGRLLADEGIEARRIELAPPSLQALDAELRRRLDPANPAVWVDPGGEESGHVNRAEWEEVVRTAVALARAWRGSHTGPLPPDLIGVVTPYRAQCHAIRQGLRDALGEADAREIEVDTVDRFQGREKEAMLVSLVARDWSDFVFDARRMNVTLTRARSKIVVFGAKELGRRMVETFAEK